MDDYSERLIEAAQVRLQRFDESLLTTFESAIPRVVHEKAHAYPVSVPELWRKTDEGIVDWSAVDDRPLRLYVHIPWCKAKCTFCFYESKATIPTETAVEEYLDQLGKELRFYKERLGRDVLVAETLYIGGGTPSALTECQISSLLSLIHSEVTFTDRASLITEVSPGTLTPGKVQAFLSGGVNRISIGVQSFQDHLLKLVGRDHDAAGAIRAYWFVRDAGIPEVNFDLMVALPNQTLNDFAQSIVKTLELAPSSVSFLDLRVAPGSILYDLNYYYSNWYDEITMRAMYQQAFADDGRYQRTRPHYYLLPEQARGRSTRCPCLDSRPGNGFQIGIGVKAISHIGSACIINSTNPVYGQQLASGCLPVDAGLLLSDAQHTAIEAIRSIVDYTLVPDAPRVLSQYSRQVEKLQEKGLLDNRCQLTADGCLFGEEIAYMFYPEQLQSKLVTTTSSKMEVVR